MSKYFTVTKNGTSEEEKKERIDNIRYFIDQIRYDTGQSALTDEDSIKMATSWYGHLERNSIALPYLNELYSIALENRAHASYAGPFTIEDILRAWFGNLKGKIDDERQYSDKTGKRCGNCNRDQGRRPVKNEAGSVISWVDCDHVSTDEEVFLTYKSRFAFMYSKSNK